MLKIAVATGRVSAIFFLFILKLRILFYLFGISNFIMDFKASMWTQCEHVHVIYILTYAVICWMWVCIEEKLHLLFKIFILLPGKNKLDFRKVLADSIFVCCYFWKGLNVLTFLRTPDLIWLNLVYKQK